MLSFTSLAKSDITLSVSDCDAKRCISYFFKMVCSLSVEVIIVSFDDSKKRVKKSFCDSFGRFGSPNHNCENLVVYTETLNTIYECDTSELAYEETVNQLFQTSPYQFLYSVQQVNESAKNPISYNDCTYIEAEASHGLLVLLKYE